MAAGAPVVGPPVAGPPDAGAPGLLSSRAFINGAALLTHVEMVSGLPKCS
jgi:hypothetical protein